MDSDHSPLHKRLAWMALIWVLSVSALGVVAMIIRFWLSWSGMALG